MERCENDTIRGLMGVCIWQRFQVTDSVIPVLIPGKARRSNPTTSSHNTGSHGDRIWLLGLQMLKLHPERFLVSWCPVLLGLWPLAKKLQDY